MTVSLLSTQCSRTSSTCQVRSTLAIIIIGVIDVIVASWAARCDGLKVIDDHSSFGCVLRRSIFKLSIFDGLALLTMIITTSVIEIWWKVGTEWERSRVFGGAMGSICCYPLHVSPIVLVMALAVFAVAVWV